MSLSLFSSLFLSSFYFFLTFFFTFFSLLVLFLSFFLSSFSYWLPRSFFLSLCGLASQVRNIVNFCLSTCLPFSFRWQFYCIRFKDEKLISLLLLLLFLRILLLIGSQVILFFFSFLGLYCYNLLNSTLEIFCFSFPFACFAFPFQVINSKEFFCFSFIVLRLLQKFK